MENKTYTFNMFSGHTANCIEGALTEISKNCSVLPPTIICIGSDLVLGDSLGPLVGTMLRESKMSAYVYGTLNYPITAKEVNYAKEYLNKIHPNSLVVAIDAAVGDESEIGCIKIYNKGLKPGLGVNKDLEEIGDISIIGIVAEKSVKNYTLYNLTRLGMVYKMAEQISEGIIMHIEKFKQKIEIAQ